MRSTCRREDLYLAAGSAYIDVSRMTVAQPRSGPGAAAGALNRFELGGESSCVSTLTEVTNLLQPLVTQHTKVLQGNKMVTVTRAGAENFYALVDDRVAHVIATPSPNAGKPSPDAGNCTPGSQID